MTSSPGNNAEATAVRALSWLLAQAKHSDDGMYWAGSTDDPDPNPTLYSGSAGILLTLLESHHHFEDDRYADAALAGARALTATVDSTAHSSLYFGLTGTAFALHEISEHLGDTAAGLAAARALGIVRSRFNGERWSDQFELLGGNAGIALGALAMGDEDLAVLAVTPYLRAAEPTVSGGVHWEVKVGVPARFHHISHGTLGIVHALAAVGDATGRMDFTDLAVAGATDVVSRNEAGPQGFLVPHSDPQHKPALIERYSYGWCHGPAGDAQTFRLLHAATQDPVWIQLADRCWNTVIHSGIPNRVRPGFWDNNGRCCGTAGVLALACDRIMESGDTGEFANILVTDLVARATDDHDGARWSNYEHRAEAGDLAPRTGWAMGNAGIIRELLRYVRITTGKDGNYAVLWPDHPGSKPSPRRR